MPSGYVIRANEYYDSVFLMGINKRLSAVSGVEQTAVLMGTEANKRLLADIGFAGTQIDGAQANDLVVAVVAETMEVVENVIASFDDILADLVSGTRTSDVHTLTAAFERQPNANLAVFTIPGEFVAHEARKALDTGLNVFVFSSNVPSEQELALKQMGRDRNLLVMGPDCGTSILNGIGIGFANAVRRGTIGAVGPSGTGLQEFTTQVHNGGGGISHAIGTGSNDLSDAIGGLTTLTALEWLDADPQTEIIAIIAKPPGEQTLSQIVEKARALSKPLIGCFLGAEMPSGDKSMKWARTIDDAVSLALEMSGVKTAKENGVNVQHDDSDLEALRSGWMEGARFVRGIFAGGTFSYQAQQILNDAGAQVYSNSPISTQFKLTHPDQSIGHSMIDMGDEHYTLGKPHPMIDGSERAKRILREAADPDVAILLLDFIFGYNASNDPVGELVDVLKEAQAMRRNAGGELTVVASVCGTSDDLQDMVQQAKMLEECGAIVFNSSARAVRYCLALLEKDGLS